MSFEDRTPPRSRGYMTAQAGKSYVTRAIRLPVQRYIHTESIGAFVLLAMTLLALAWANSPWRESYHSLTHTYLTLDAALFSIDLSIEKWVNDGLMAIFFFVVGLEIKREIMHGQLSTLRRAALPVVAAIGGMVVPAAVYLAFNPSGEAMRGWGVPMATDIAFAMGVLAILGRRAPQELRVFLLGLAVVDDLGAIAVIAIAYTESIDFTSLAIAGALVAVMFASYRLGFGYAVVTAALSLMIWAAVLKTGIHATVAGVVIGALMPSQPNYNQREFGEEADALMAEYHTAVAAGDRDRSEAIIGEMEELSQGTEAPLERLERLMHPWASYVILPIFALVNAGIDFRGAESEIRFSNSVLIGVFAGLLVGKVVGITLFPWAASKLGVVDLPENVTWTHVIGVGFVAGVGFTVAIFISGLAFEDAGLVATAKLGILLASLAAGLAGYLILRFWRRGDESGGR